MTRRISGAQRRFALALLAGALVSAPAAAQQVPGRPLKDIEVDRIVAVVGKHPVLFSEVLEAINFARSRGLTIPDDTVGQLRIAREFLDQIVDKEVLITVAKDYKIEVTETDVSKAVEDQVDGARKQFRSEAETNFSLFSSTFA